MPDLIRSATLTHYAEVARAAGVDPARMLRRVRLPPDCLRSQELRVPVAGLRRLLEISAAASGVETFGLRMAESADLPLLGPVALVVREQPTIGTALEALTRFIHIHNEGMSLALSRDDDFVTIDVVFRGRAQRQTTELAVGGLHRLLRILAGANWRPLEIHLIHSRPRQLREHRQFFGCDITFDSDFDGIVCAARDMDRKIPTANPELGRYVQSRVEAVYARQASWDAKIGELVHLLLAGGDCRIERVAAYLSCDRRTVHRHLADCGTSFSKILDAQRAELATRLVEDRAKPLAAIAEQLGFSAQSALARWFRHRFGCSITEWRMGRRPQGLPARKARLSPTKTAASIRLLSTR
jgi:AraC-like DNA-binding protein